MHESTSWLTDQHTWTAIGTGLASIFTYVLKSWFDQRRIKGELLVQEERLKVALAEHNNAMNKKLENLNVALDDNTNVTVNNAAKLRTIVQELDTNTKLTKAIEEKV